MCVINTKNIYLKSFFFSYKLKDEFKRKRERERAFFSKDDVE